jgi:hypothetical protein
VGGGEVVIDIGIAVVQAQAFELGDGTLGGELACRPPAQRA